MNDLPDILPCPFCGSSASVEEVEEKSSANTKSVRFSVGCTEDRGNMCMGYQSFTTFNSQREAIEAWNKRTP
jgi:Lar family restriction alleviation protein